VIKDQGAEIEELESALADRDALHSTTLRQRDKIIRGLQNQITLQQDELDAVKEDVGSLAELRNKNITLEMARAKAATEKEQYRNDAFNLKEKVCSRNIINSIDLSHHTSMHCS
jgi:hypothetical protein